jgi:capsular exopolysaccharide synthesis family protein
MQVTVTPERRLVSLTEEQSLGAEKIRILGAKLRHMRQRRPMKTILVTSTVKDEGKSVLSANLAIALAKTNQRVLLLDGDLHQPNQARLLGVAGLSGLSGWWRANEPILNYMRKINGLQLWFLPAGEPLDQALEMLQSQKLADLLGQVAHWFDWIIIDSPPVAPLADSAVWVNMTDATLLLARLGRTPKKLIKKVVESLDKQKLLGIVLNECSDPHLSYYSQYYGQVHQRPVKPQTKNPG